MAIDQTPYNRNTLYEQVWTEPVRTVAKRYGVSDSALSKICRRLKVPLPGVGYWQKKAVGKAPPKPPLPSTDGPEEIPRNAGQRSAFSSDRKSAEQGPSRIVVNVPDRLLNPHPLVHNTLKGFEGQKPGEDGLLWPRGKNTLDIRASAQNVHRAMCIMDALLKTLEGRGHKITITTDYRSDTHVLIQEAKIPISLKELTRRSTHLPTADERKWGFYDKYDYHPSGKLMLRMANPYGTLDVLSDGKRHPLETRLGAFIEKIELLAEEERLRHERQNQEARERRERERQRLEQEARELEQRRELEAILREAEGWENSQRIRAFVAAVRETVIQLVGEVKADSELERWIRWALAHADRIDPLVSLRNEAAASTAESAQPREARAQDSQQGAR